GLDLNAAKKAFAKYLDERNLNSNQIYFVNQVVEFIVRNGVMKDFSVLQESPFVDKGSIVDLFGDDLQIWNGIRNVISNINQNALYA
uniref:type I restriction-modification enzyme R subunit C-terminal domain-containing protein n=1 Tax=Thomasclavelia sp. TaxID=3025757 RepID=UPI0025D76823